ncbi:nucleotidyltransferase family protein [Pedobacter immunditicola]|uniref:nucleotidyltransferase family protein n=1 Tax=Pedobacter immunditicola TaxID=3133440 RepID=UPI0030A701F2
MRPLSQLKDIIISPESTLLSALKRMDEVRKKLLLVFDNQKYIGLLSIGDLQRAIISGVDLNIPITNVIKKDVIIAKPENTIEDIKKIMLTIRAEFMPVVSDDGDLVDIHFWEDLFGLGETAPVKQFNLPVVIMAGGFGTRLKPLTNVLPKPLIPIGEKTMLEEIFDRFGKHGCNHFFISVNYKAELIEYYLKSQNLPYVLDFFKEEEPMGTAGSLTLLKGKINETFMVSNCDILIEQDYSEILDYHKEHKNEITIVAALKHYPIPYGIVESGDNGQLLELREKPEMTFKINSGMYILEPHLLDEIPENKFFHITQLIEKIQNKNGKIGVFPISEKSWKDVGLLSEYISSLNEY